MLVKTRGIVFGYHKYGETSIICRIYTETLGLKSYLVNGVRQARLRRGQPGMAHFQPLTRLEMVVYNRDHANLNRLSEVRCPHPYRTLSEDFRKTTIGIFLSEVLSKSVREEGEPNEELFGFLFDSFGAFDALPTYFSDFHLQFMLRLSRYLGFYPASPAAFFSEIYGTDNWKSVVAESEQNGLQRLLTTPYDAPTGLNTDTRRQLLDHLVKLYRLHVENFSEPRSLAVLQEIMR